MEDNIEKIHPLIFQNLTLEKVVKPDFFKEKTLTFPLFVNIKEKDGIKRVE